MNAFFKLSVTLLTVSFLAISNTYAQSSTKGFEAGISGGTIVYQGDLASNIGNVKRLKPALGIYVGRIISPYFSMRLNFATGKITAYDADYSENWRHTRNLNFETPVNELTARIVFSPLGSYSLTTDRRLYPYIFAGAGASFLHIKRDWSHVTAGWLQNGKGAEKLAADTLHTLASVISSFPIGGGISYVLSPTISVFGEGTYHIPVTDYLDGFSYAGNPTRKDNYYMMNIGIHFTFLQDHSTRCPVVNP